MVDDNWRNQVPTRVYLRDILAPYTKNTGIWLCPSDSRTTNWSSYNLKMWIYWYGPKLAQYNNVAGSVMFHEEDANHGPVRVNSNDKRSEHNVCYVDGHVKWIQHSKYLQATVNGGSYDFHWYWNQDLGDY